MDVFVIILAVIGGVLVLGLVAWELFEGIWSLDMFNGDDEEWIAPLAMLSLIAYVAGLSYFS